jgi:hypothetical protein
VGENVFDEPMMHTDRCPPRRRQHVLAVEADCWAISGDYGESLATYTEAYGPQLHDWSLAVERNSIGTRAQGPGVLSRPVRDRVRRIPTRNEVRHCKAQAASLAVDTAPAAELADAWPLER